MDSVKLGKRLDHPSYLSLPIIGGGNALIGGITGYGKSNEANLICYQVARLPYVQMVLCNAAGKTDFVNWLPRAAGVAVGSNATVSCLEALVSLMETRYKDLLPANAKHMTPAKAVEIARSSKREIDIDIDNPLILLVVDEFTRLIAEDKGFKKAKLLIYLLTVGRAAGIMTVLATQRPSQFQAPTDIRSACPNKIGFRIDSHGAVMVFGEIAEGIPFDDLATRGEGYAMVDGETEPLHFIAPLCTDLDCGKRAIATAAMRQEVKGVEWLGNDHL